MTLTCENDNHVIVYTLELIIFFARNNQYILVAQCIWLVSSIIGLQQGRVIRINNLKFRIEKSKQLPDPVETDIFNLHLDRVIRIESAAEGSSESQADKADFLENDTHDRISENCEVYLQQSTLERKKIARTSLLISMGFSKKKIQRMVNNYYTQIQGIHKSELNQRKTAGKCQQCAWPQDQKGGHKTLDCFGWKRLEKGTAPFTNKKNYNNNTI